MSRETPDAVVAALAGLVAGAVLTGRAALFDFRTLPAELILAARDTAPDDG